MVKLTKNKSNSPWVLMMYEVILNCDPIASIQISDDLGEISIILNIPAVATPEFFSVRNKIQNILRFPDEYPGMKMFTICRGNKITVEAASDLEAKIARVRREYSSSVCKAYIKLMEQGFVSGTQYQVQQLYLAGFIDQQQLSDITHFYITRLGINRSIYGFRYNTFAPNYTYLIVGSGAIGSILSTALYEHGCDASLLCGSNFHTLLDHGITVQRPGTLDRRTHLKLFDKAQPLPQTDVVILCNKAYSNPEVLQSLAARINPKVIITIQNGIGLEDEIKKHFPNAHIVIGVCWIKATRIAPDCVVHSFGNKVDVGELDLAAGQVVQPSDLVWRVHDDFLLAHLNVSPSSQLTSIVWTKLAFNLPLCAYSIIHDVSSTALLNHEDYKREILALLDEIVILATACGQKINMIAVNESLEKFAKAVPENFHSMKLDFDAGLPLEKESSFDRLQQIAREHSIAMPILDAAISMLNEKLIARTSTKHCL